MLGDPHYRCCLWESIFLYAAETPMLITKKLSLGQNTWIRDLMVDILLILH
jgi:hypothetical protein